MTRRGDLPVLLLPGMMCDARLFAPQIATLSARRTVICANLAGAETMAALAAAVLADAPPRFAVAGLSMGGILAMEILRLAPERVAGLALMDTNPLSETEVVKASRQPQIDRAAAGDLAAMMSDTFISRYFQDAEARPDLVALCLDMALALGPEVFRSQSLALRDRSDRCETLRASRVPTLILTGSEDRLCPMDRHRLMHDLMPHARFTIIENCGHLPTLERPQETTEALLQWLDA